MGDILLCPILTTTMGRHRTQPPFIDGRLIMTESTQRPWSYELSMDKENWIEDMEESRENLEGLVQRLTIQNDALVAALEAAYDQLPCVCGDNFETCDCAVAKVTAALSEQVK